ncbi:unnamed protein product, partial [Closterium sp. NIES-54]
YRIPPPRPLAPPPQSFTLPQPAPASAVPRCSSSLVQHSAVPRSSTSKAPPSPPPPAVPRPCPFPLVRRVTHIQQWSS